MHATTIDESQIRGISYEHSHAPCTPISCDYCDYFDHDVNTSPLLSRPHRLEALVAFNREIHLLSLLKNDLSLGSSTPEVRSCEDFVVGSYA